MYGLEQRAAHIQALLPPINVFWWATAFIGGFTIMAVLLLCLAGTYSKVR